MLITTIFAHDMGRSTRSHGQRKALLCRGDSARRIRATSTKALSSGVIMNTYKPSGPLHSGDVS